MKIKVLEVTGTTARVEAVSRKKVDGLPQATIQIEVRARKPLTEELAKDIALRYLDPA